MKLQLNIKMQIHNKLMLEEQVKKKIKNSYRFLIFFLKLMKMGLKK